MVKYHSCCRGREEEARSDVIRDVIGDVIRDAVRLTAAGAVARQGKVITVMGCGDGTRRGM